MELRAKYWVRAAEVFNATEISPELVGRRGTVLAARVFITFVKDRPGHDRRYAIDSSKIEAELGWQSTETFATGIRRTLEWYLQNEAWSQAVTSGSYRQRMVTQDSMLRWNYRILVYRKQNCGV